MINKSCLGGLQIVIGYTFYYYFWWLKMQKYHIVSGQNLEIQAIVNQSKAASAIGASATKAAEQAPSNAGQKVRRLL